MWIGVLRGDVISGRSLQGTDSPQESSVFRVCNVFAVLFFGVMLRSIIQIVTAIAIPVSTSLNAFIFL
jgi:hypothetical protein